MKISVDDVELFSLTDIQQKVIQNDIQSEIFDADMKRRLHYILMHKYEQCFMRLKQEWEPKLIAEGAKSLPTDQEEFAKLVFARPDYKNRSDRDLQSLLVAPRANI